MSAPSRVRSILRPVLHRGHFAFFRGVIQGLSARLMWLRYLADLGDSPDVPAVHRMTGWIRNELRAAAARAGNFGRAHLLRLDLAPLTSDALPSLADFVAAHALDGFAEAEQLALYTERYGGTVDVQRRRARLLRRQLWAVHLAESQLARPVSLGDACGVWFVDTLAARLAGAGIVTMEALHARMTASPDWWQSLRGIGAGKAQAITHFVAAHAQTLGALPDWPPANAPQATPAARATAPLVASAFSPLERLVVQDELNGRTGRFRAPREACLLDADNDLDAIRAWLDSKASAPLVDAVPEAVPRLTNTQLSYRREAERFLLFMLLERHRAFSSATIEDCVAYRQFLMHPPAHWCGPRSNPRWRCDWRPLEGALSPRSIRFALSVLHNLGSFLVLQGYLRANPWPAVQPPPVANPGLGSERAFSEAVWQFVQAALDRLSPTPANRRLALAVGLLYETGLRLAELIAARTGDLAWRRLVQPPGADETGWWLTLVGKGHRIRRVPVTDAWLSQLSASLVARGLPPDPRHAPDVPLLASVEAGAPVTAGISRHVFHAQIKAFFARCAAELAPSDPQGAALLLRASTHWLRHTSISHALARGASVEMVRENAGHASLSTTTAYVRVEEARRGQTMRGVWSPRSPAAPGESAESDDH